MSRYAISFLSPYSPQQVNNCFLSYMNSEGFKITTKKGESFWKKGVGLLTAPQCIKLTQQNNVYTLEAWLPFAVLPGVYVGEMGIDGFVGCLPKSFLEARVKQLLTNLLAQPIQSTQGMPYRNPNVPQPQGNYYGNPNVPQPQGNYYGNPNVPQPQGSYYSNPNIPQGNPYGTPNIPQQMQHTPVVQNINNQPVNQYNQGR